MNETCISIRQLSVFYGKSVALKDISLSIPGRQITAIIGPSGCGKTTLLRSINRLIESTDETRVSGDILVDGQNVMDRRLDVTSLRKKIGLLAQKPSPLPMSIYDNVAYGPRIHGERDRKALDRTVQDCLQTVSLWDEVKHRLRAPASRLSVGQQQRLCLARSLAVRPEVLLCDEPTSALDPVSSQTIEKKLVELKKDYTIVIVTHNIHQAIRLADYVIHLYLGELVEHGPANEVFEHPKEERTRAYINGTFLADIKFDKELDLKGTKCPYNFVYAKLALDELAEGNILRIIVDDPTAVTELPRGMEADDYEVVNVNQLNKTDWEIVIRK
jgi:phosphate transport system ATP-binding protein